MTLVYGIPGAFGKPHFSTFYEYVDWSEANQFSEWLEIR